MSSLATEPSVLFRELPEYPGYRVGSDGSVWSRWQLQPLGGRRGTVSFQGAEWKRMQTGPDENGYPAVRLRTGPCRSRYVRVHALVLTAFVGPCPAGMEGCHENGNPADCWVENLRWDTHAGNMKDMADHGRSRRGQANPNVKLTESQAKEVRRRLLAGETVRSIAAEFGISVSHAKSIRLGRFWAWANIGDECGSTSGCS